MTSVPVRVLMQDLFDRNEHCLAAVMQLKNFSIEQLTAHPKNGAWSALECVQHLNLYAQYYLPLISQCFDKKNEWQTYDTIYKATWWGDWFAKSMLPDAHGQIKKMSSQPSKKPRNIGENIGLIDNLIEALTQLKEIFGFADKYNVNKRAVTVAIFPLLKINYGDALRFLVYHNQRHIAQAQRALKII